jgi:hypothetical protein
VTRAAAGAAAAGVSPRRYFAMIVIFTSVAPATVR